MSQHLGAFARPVLVSGICYWKLEDGPGADLFWALGCGRGRVT